MRWIRKVSIADYVTLANGLLGFLAITYIVDGEFTEAYLLLFLCIFIDGIDGRLARFFKSRHRFGQYIDSFGDAISFCFAPALLLYSNFFDPTRGSAFMSLENAIAVLFPALFLCFGILRLARFAAGGYREKNFLGLPTPAAAFLVINLCILFGFEGLVASNELMVLSVGFLVSLLMISDIPYPKISGGLIVPGTVSVVMAIIYSSLLALHVLTPLVLVLTVLALLFIVAYIIGGPLYVRFSESERPAITEA